MPTSQLKSTTAKIVTKEKVQPTSGAGDTNASKQLFVGATLSMSWQLAVVVLVPLYGGYRLDEHFHSSPLWTVIGFLLAIALSVIVMKRAIQELNRSFISTSAASPKTPKEK